MTTQMLQPHDHHRFGRGAALAVAGAALAASAGYGVFTWVTDDPRVTTPTQTPGGGVVDTPGPAVPPPVTPDRLRRLKLDKLQ